MFKDLPPNLGFGFVNRLGDFDLELDTFYVDSNPLFWFSSISLSSL